MGEELSEDFQNILQGRAHQRLHHRRQRLGRTGHGPLGSGHGPTHGRQEVSGADADGGNVEQELLGGGIDLRVAPPEGAQRRLATHRLDVGAAVS